MLHLSGYSIHGCIEACLWIQTRWLFKNPIKSDKAAFPAESFPPSWDPQWDRPLILFRRTRKISYSRILLIRCVGGQDHLYAAQRLNRGFTAPSSTFPRSELCPRRSGGCVSHVDKACQHPQAPCMLKRVFAGGAVTP